MHMWGPEDPLSLGHLAMLDGLLDAAREAAPDAMFLITADHGMNPKQRCLDLRKLCAKTASGSVSRSLLWPTAWWNITGALAASRMSISILKRASRGPGVPPRARWSGGSPYPGGQQNVST